MTVSVKLNLSKKNAISVITHHLDIIQKEREDFESNWTITSKPGLQYHTFHLISPDDRFLKTYCEIRLRELDDTKTNLTVFDPDWTSTPIEIIFRGTLNKSEIAYLEETGKYDIRFKMFERYVSKFNKRKDEIVKTLITRLKSDDVVGSKIQNGQPEKDKYGFVSQARIKQLKKIKSTEYDLRKLIQFCEELNYTYTGKCYLSTALLLRAVIDHIPPIFEKFDFSQVVSEYNWSTKKASLKKTPSAQKMMERLDGSLRDLANYHIHSHIHKKVSLVDKVQVNFSSEFGILLDEVIYLLKNQG